MGMGEPLANYANLVAALRILTDAKLGLGYSPRRITVSTVGLVSGIDRLGARGPQGQPGDLAARGLRRGARAAHAGEPLLEPRRAAWRRCAAIRWRRGSASSSSTSCWRTSTTAPEEAQRLARLLRGIRAKVNLIPFNDWDGSGFRRPPLARILAFQAILAGRRDHDDGALEQGRGHRRRLRPARRSRSRPRDARQSPSPRWDAGSNQADTQQLQTRARGAAGSARSRSQAAPDVVVVNTCTVTARAELSDRQAIRRAAPRSTRARAWSSPAAGRRRARARWRRSAASTWWSATPTRRGCPTLLAELARSRRGRRASRSVDVGGARLRAVAPARGAHGRARAFVKVQDGCQHRCAFCIVPFARGGSRSLAPEVVEDQVRRLVEAGHPEVVLTGVDLGHYGADLAPRSSLAALLARLAQRARACAGCGCRRCCRPISRDELLEIARRRRR